MAAQIGDILIEDILVPSLFIYLDHRDLLNLMKTNTYMKSAVKYFTKNIKKIDFSSKPSHSYSVDEFSELYENCTNIRELNFQGCGWLRDSHLRPLISNNFRTLKSVNIRFCDRISIQGIEMLANCRKLKIFEFNHKKFIELNDNQSKKTIRVFRMLTENNSNLNQRYLAEYVSMLSKIRRRLKLLSRNSLTRGLF